MKVVLLATLCVWFSVVCGVLGKRPRNRDYDFDGYGDQRRYDLYPYGEGRNYDDNSRKVFRLREFNERCRTTLDCRHFGYVCRDNSTCQCDYMFIPDTDKKTCVGGVDQKCIYDEHCIEGAFCMNQAICKCKDTTPIVLAEGLICSGQLNLVQMPIHHLLSLGFSIHFVISF